MYLPIAVLVLVSMVAGAPTLSIDPMASRVMYLMHDGKLQMSELIEPFQQLPSIFPSGPFLSSISKPIESVILDKSEVKVGEKDFVAIPSGPGDYYALPLTNEENLDMPVRVYRSITEPKEEEVKEIPEEIEEAMEIPNEEESEEKEKFEEMPEEMEEMSEEPAKPAEEIKEPELVHIKLSLNKSDFLASMGSLFPMTWPSWLPQLPVSVPGLSSSSAWPSWLPQLPVSVPGLSSSSARVMANPHNQVIYYIPAAAPIKAFIK